MDNEDFKLRLEKDLKTLNYTQKRRFSWLCGVRALPFLGGRGHFDFWADNDRQRHIYFIFRALDRGSAFAFAASDAAASDAADITDAQNAYLAASAAAKTVYATYAASASVSATSVTSAASVASVANFAAAQFGMDLTLCILSDLASVKLPNKEQKYCRPDWYGKVWDNFQAALRKEGCAYWGRMYQRIFDDGLAVDLEALERRLSIPVEITNQGAAEVASYLEELEKGATRLNEARIIILGDKGAGKTCIARRLVDPKAAMTTSSESTAAVDTMPWELEQENINVRIWDFAGHTVTHAVHQFFLSERCLYLVVYDGRTEERNRLDYWLDHMTNYGGESRAIILVNEHDCHSVDIPINNLVEKYSIAGIYYFSIENDAEKLLTFRDKVAEYIKGNLSWERELIPQSYFLVKEELEKRFVKDEEGESEEHITKKEFDEIAKRFKVSDTENLLLALHSLGVSLWYQDMDDFDTLVLNPEWISYGVYRIINWVNEKKGYSLKIEDLEAVFMDDLERYPIDKHSFFFELMRRFELAYKVADVEQLIIPHLLKEDRPDSLPDFPIGDSLMLRYVSEQPLPPHTISRFIVRHNEEIKQNGKEFQAWRYGVVLRKGSTATALVREEDRIISVSVKGSDKTNYISLLRKTLNDIFNSYKSKNPELQYRIERYGSLPDEMEREHPLWVNNESITRHHEKRRTYYDPYSDQDIDMGKIVNNYNITAKNVHVGQRNTSTINIYDCNIDLQGNLNELAQLLTESGKSEEAKELAGAAKALERIEKNESKEEMKKSGTVSRLKRLLESLANEDSTLHKAVRGIDNGVSIAQDIAKRYNDLAQWTGLPQVPEPFLKST